jgi:hypothetical protein
LIALDAWLVLLAAPLATGEALAGVTVLPPSAASESKGIRVVPEKNANLNRPTGTQTPRPNPSSLLVISCLLAVRVLSRPTDTGKAADCPAPGPAQLEPAFKLAARSWFRRAGSRAGPQGP